MIGFDTETHPITPQRAAPRMVCASLSDGVHSVVTHRRDPRSQGRILAAFDEGVVGHNVAYDLGVIQTEYPEKTSRIFEALDAGRVSDTMLRERLIRISRGEPTKSYDSLAALAQRRLGRHLEKEDTWRLRYAGLDDVPVEEWPADAVAYARDDASVTLEVWQAQEKHLDVLSTEGEQVRAAYALHLAGAWGMHTDRAMVSRVRSALRVAADEVIRSLVPSGLVRPDGSRDMKKIKARVAAAWPHGDVPLTETEQVATDADTLERCGDPTLALVGVLTSLQKDVGGKGILASFDAGVVHTRFDPCKDTGRTGSAGPNVQNITKHLDPRVRKILERLVVPVTGIGYRECLVPRPGCVFLSCDYPQLELHTLGELCLEWFGRSELADRVNAGIDVHSALGARILGVEYEEFVRRKKEPAFANARQTAKPANFGFPGGMGIARFIDSARSDYGVILSDTETRALKAQWLAENPVMFEYFRRADSLSSAGLPVEFRGFVRGGVGYCDACNTPFQGLGALAAKRALWLVTRECYADPDSPLYGSRPVNLIHDDLWIETPAMDLDRKRERVSHLMATGANEYVPRCPFRAEDLDVEVWSRVPSKGG